MALKRDMLKAMGLSEEQINSIISEHTASIDGIKSGYDNRISALETEIESVKTAKADSDKLLTDTNKAFDDYKAEITAKESNRAKAKAYRNMLSEIGISDKRMDSIMRVTDLSNVELENGEIKDADKLRESVKAEWSEFIPTPSVVGANITNPPTNVGGAKMTKDEIFKIADPIKRQKAIADNIELFR